MNKETFFELKEFLVFRGFGALLDSEFELERRVLEDTGDFILMTSASFDESTVIKAVVHFRKSVRRDKYFVLKYDTSLHYLNDPKEDKAQSFFSDDGTIVSLKEAYNLLQGRSVYYNVYRSSGEPYNTWLQLNFGHKDMHNNYDFIKYRSGHGYSLEKALELYPIEEMQNEVSKRQLIASLKKGNLHPVHFIKKHRTELKLIEANPGGKRINIYAPFPKKQAKCEA